MCNGFKTCLSFEVTGFPPAEPEWQKIEHPLNLPTQGPMPPAWIARQMACHTSKSLEIHDCINQFEGLIFTKIVTKDGNDTGP